MTTHQPVKDIKPSHTQIFINNEWHKSVSGKTFATVNPATAVKIADIQEGDKADVEAAVAAARTAFKHGSAWRKLDASKRAELINKLADLLQDDLAAFATLETLDNGKPFTAAIMDMLNAVNFLKQLGSYATKICGKTIPVDGEFMCYTRLEPVGVVGAILPWNFPMVLLANKLGHALATGCTIVLKPAEQTPLTTLRLCELIVKAGFPPGVVNVVPGYGPTVGAAIASDPHIAKVTFTGSTEVGRLIMKASGESNLKKVTLELGGKSPNIIFPDADLDHAVEWAHQGAMLCSGQCCIAGQRVFVHEDIHDEFVRRSVARANTRKVGDPFDPKTEGGPQIDKTQQDKIIELIESAIDEGAALLCGGDTTGNPGYFVESSVFSGVKDEMRIAKEEVFGPVQLIFKFKTIDEVLERANNTTYGLAAGVFTKDLDTAVRCANELEAGSVWVNTYFQIQPYAPFGGYKQSGIGREFSEEGMKEYCEVKTVYIASPGTK